MKKYLANIASVANALCGILAIIFALQGSIEFAVRFIFLGFFFDAIDGTLARTFGSRPNGKILDRAADRISQGMAPGMLFAAFFEWQLSALLFGILFSSLGLWSLTKHNTSPEYFSGLPLSIVALAILGTVMSGITMPLAVFFIFGLLVFLRRIRYPRRLSRPSVAHRGARERMEKELREPMPLIGFIAGKTWIVRAVLLSTIALLPVEFWTPVGIIILLVALPYVVIGPMAYVLIQRGGTREIS